MAGTHQHDKGYKELYQNKTVFLDLLRNILNLDWAQGVEPDDLTLVDKSYVTGDFSELESDLVYRMKLDEQEIILYVLLEFQSTVDHRMPVRLLFYMVEILREYLKEKNYSAGDTKIKIPAIYPIVLYNGAPEWTAKQSLREITEGGELCGENILNLRYALIDSNHEYTEEELLANDCISSIILLLDRKGDVPTALRRFAEIVERFRSLGEGQNRQIIEQFIRHCGNPKISASMADILRAEGKEAREMVSNLSKLWVDDIEEAKQKARQEALLEGRQKGRLEGRQEGRQEGRREGRQEGRQEGRLESQKELIRSMAQEGASFEFIAKVAKMPVDKIKQFLQ